MRLNIRHTTRYHHDNPPPYALYQLRLQPKETRGQSILGWHTEAPGGTRQCVYTDHHNNHVELWSFDGSVSEIAITCHGEVGTRDTVGSIGPHSGPAPLWYLKRQTAITQPGPATRQLVRDFRADHENDDPMTQMHALSALILDRVSYETGMTDSVTTAEEALVAGHGVCQDHAHLFVSAARQMGYPARYVGGYLYMDDRVEQDAGHAWVEAHIPNMGWIGFDISNGISPDERYVRVATGLDYSEAAPIAGMNFGDRAHSMDVRVQVEQQT